MRLMDKRLLVTPLTTLPGMATAAIAGDSPMISGQEIVNQQNLSWSLQPVLMPEKALTGWQQAV